jgi:hypothetical protein
MAGRFVIMLSIGGARTQMCLKVERKPCTVLVDVAQLQAFELPHRLTYDVCGL